MAYNKTIFQDGDILHASDLNKIEEGISTLDQAVSNLPTLYETFTATTTGGFNTGSGTISNWSWIVHKHSDGLCECYGSGYFYASGASFSSVVKGPYINLPITFTETPYISCLATDPGRNDTYIWFTFPSATTSSTGSVHYMGSTHDDIVWCRFHVVGRWK